jgi:hypothetical protein
MSPVIQTGVISSLLSAVWSLLSSLCSLISALCSLLSIKQFSLEQSASTMWMLEGALEHCIQRLVHVPNKACFSLHHHHKIKGFGNINVTIAS